jgi:uncharacterized protein YhdP
MQVRNVAGHVASIPKLQVKAEAQIPDFHASVVGVKGQIQGPLADSLTVVNTSPIAGLMNQALARAKGNGNADVQLQLQLPVAPVEQSQVQGTDTLPGNDQQ